MKDQYKTKQARSESEHRKVEQALKESDKSGWTILENIKEGYYEVDLAGNYTFFNSSMSEILGYTEEEMMGMNYRLYTDKENAKKIFRDFNEVYRTGISSKVDYEQIEKDGSKLYVETSVALMRDSLGQAIGFRGIVRDITERRQMEEALRESVEMSRSYLENAPDGIYMSDLEGNFLYGNLKCEEIIGYRREELIGKNFLELNILSENSLNKAIQLLQANMEGKPTGPDEIELISKEGRLIPVEISTSVVQRMGQRIVLAFVRDITDRKRAVEALRESEEKYRWMLDNMADVITVMDMNLRFTYVSPSIIRMRGYTAEEATAQTFEQVMTPESLQISAKVFEEEMRLEASGTADPDRIRIVVVEQYRKDGSIVLMENHLSFMRDEAKKPVGIISVSHDITDRKRAEEELRLSEENFRRSLDESPLGISIVSEKGEILYANRAILDFFGYESIEQLRETPVTKRYTRSNYAEFLDRKEKRRLHADDPSDYEIDIVRKDGEVRQLQVWRRRVLWNGKEHYQVIYRDITDGKRIEEALESEHTLLQNLIDNVPDRIYAKDSEGRFIICNEAMIRRMGLTSMTELVGKSDFDLLPLEMAQQFHADEQAIIQSGKSMINREEPLTTEGGKITRWNLATKVPLLDKQGNRIGIVGVGREITDLKLAEQKLKDTLESLRKAVGVTIQVMVSAVETRDPYTSGHQLRSADLARAIATEMGLPQDKIEGIRMAGSIHDIGKLSIPAEILSKPTKLSALELLLLKEHANKGYEILKDVVSPWPLAEIVRQHHERMDGSGYPRNLKGDEILIEARILAVADTVEAMASHRPYRPGLGIDAALNEIKKNSGTFYDKDVVDACLRLFREKGFKLEETPL
jgi:PAS domain S-box-containing protein